MSVGTFFKTIGKVAFPFITMAAQAGGPYTAMAAQTVGKALGIDGGVKADPVEIENAMAKAVMNPEQQLALQKSEQDFQLQIQQLTNERIKTAQEFEAHLEEIAAKDRDSARNREIQVRDNTPKILAYGIVILALLVTVLIAYAFITGKPTTKDVLLAGLLGTIIGYIFAEVKTVYSYYFGSSAGSERKTELLAQAPAIDGSMKLLTIGKDGSA